MPIVMVIGIPAAVIGLLYLLIGMDPRPFVGAFLGDALDSSLTTIGICLLVWLAYAVVYSFLVRSGSTRYIAALRDHTVPEIRLRWRPAVDRWRVFLWLDLRPIRELISVCRSLSGSRMIWTAATHPQLN